MNIYIYGSQSFKKEIHQTLEHANIRFKLGDNTLIKSNMAIAIEPMLNLGCDDVVVNEEDGWTVSTKDGKPSAHFEHTVIATDDGPIITTTLNQEI